MNLKNLHLHSLGIQGGWILVIIVQTIQIIDEESGFWKGFKDQVEGAPFFSQDMLMWLIQHSGVFIIINILFAHRIFTYRRKKKNRGENPSIFTREFWLSGTEIRG